METEVLRIDPSRPDRGALARAAAHLREGRLVVFPTETVYGIAARADDPRAVASLREAKGRDGEKPLTLHLPSAEALQRRFAPLPEAAARLAERRLPGPVTLVLPGPAGESTGVRVPDDPVARALLEEVGAPVVASSANPAGGAPAATGEAAAAFGRGRVAVVLDAGPCRLGVASTVVRFDGDRVEVLREGALPRATVLEEAARTILFVCTGNICRSPLAAALAELALARARGIPPADLLSRGRASRSAGTDADRGNPATAEAVAEAGRRGADLRAHRSRPLTISMVERAHRVFAAAAAHRDSILEFVPGAARRVLLLDPAGGDIADPYGRGAAAYGRMAAQVEAALRVRAGDGSLEG